MKNECSNIFDVSEQENNRSQLNANSRRGLNMSHKRKKINFDKPFRFLSSQGTKDLDEKDSYKERLMTCYGDHLETENVWESLHEI